MITFARSQLIPKIFPLFTALLIAPGAAAQVTERISFPARAGDLAENSYWVISEFSEGCCVMDFDVLRWDGNSWEGNSGSSTNEQKYDWNVPLYAPASGEIASCWRNFPDDDPKYANDNIGDNDDNPPNNDKIFAGGNHVVIITDQGNAISLNHLRKGTIPRELCPSNPSNTQFPSTTDSEGYWRLASYIAPRNRPRVIEGDYIGRVGNSGSSGGVHLHWSMSRITGKEKGREEIAPSSPTRPRHGWGHRYQKNKQVTPEGWFRLRGEKFSSSGGPTMVHASPYLRRASTSAGAVKDVDTVFMSGNRAVTALVDSDNNLKLTSWELVGLDNITRKGDIIAGPVKDVQIVKPPATDQVLVAVRGQDDELKMIAYRLAPSGSFSRVADFTAGKISELAMTVAGGTYPKVVTAVREKQSGNLKLIAWDIQYNGTTSTTSIVRLGDASAGKAFAISVAPAHNFKGVFTAMRDGDNNLKVIPWKLSNDGNTITRGTGASAGKVGQTAVAPLAQGVATAVKDFEGKLRLITWSVSANGNIGSRRDEATAGSVSEISMLGTPLAGSNLTTVVRDAAGSLSLIGWAINDDGTNLRRVGSSLAGAATKISADGVSRSYPGKDPRDMILTALRDKDDNLKLITWDTNLNGP